MLNRDGLVREFQPTRVAAERDDDLIIDRTRIDPLTSRAITERTVLRGGRTRRMRFFVRLFTFTELRDWLLAVGFAAVEGYDEDGTPPSLTSRRLIVLAHRDTSAVSNDQHG
jgi:hypothetical protein